MDDRRRIIETFLKFDRPMAEILAELRALGLEDVNIGILKGQHVISILERYLAKQLTREDVSGWAAEADNLLRGGKIDYEAKYAGPLEKFIAETADLDIYGEVTPPQAQVWIAQLGGKAS